MSITVCIDPGHGGDDPGAVYGEHLEKDIALAIAEKLSLIVTSLGFAVVKTRDSDEFVSLARRADIANRAGAALFVSIHCNADPDSDEMGMAEAKGREIWVYPGSVSRVLAGHIAVALEDVMPDEPWRGVKEGNLAVLRLTRMPACLVEVGFIDNSETVRKLAQASTQYEIAQAIAYGIDRYLIDGMGSLR